MIESAGPVKVVRFFCIQPHCDVPAVWRVDYPATGEFSTVCAAHYAMLEKHFPSVSAKTRALLDGEGLPLGYDPITMTVPRANGFTWKRWVGGKPKPAVGVQR